ncbi:MAG: transposase [Caldilinea sp.]|nr:transposase [Caldilinea sp.]
MILWGCSLWHFGAPIDTLLAANPRLQLMYFPPASPELNPQEHVWKVTRTAISHNHRFARLESLAGQFLTYLSNTRFPSPCSTSMGTITFVQCLLDVSVSP